MNGEEFNETKTTGEKVKKVLFLILAAALVAIIVWVIVSSAVGGGDEDDIPDREYNEEEVATAARELLSASVLLNDIFFGKGIPYENIEGEVYCPADKDYLEGIGVTYLDDLKKLTRGVFSEEISDGLFSLFMSGTFTEGHARVAHYIADRYETEQSGIFAERGILVNKNRESDPTVRVDEKTLFDLDSIKVLGAEGERVAVEVLCTVICDDGKEESRRKTVYLIEEDDGWRLDSYSKIAYVGQNN